MVTPFSLGSAQFKSDYRCRYAYVAGAMYRGIGSADLVIKMGSADLLAFFGAGGLAPNVIEENLVRIKSALGDVKPFGMNLLCNVHEPRAEEEVVDLYLRYGVQNIEAAAYLQITPALAKFRLRGLARDPSGQVRTSSRVLAKVSRPEVAKRFLAPVPPRVVQQLLEQRKITEEQAALAASVPVADDVCVESDSGGHTDMGVALVLLPAVLQLRDEARVEHGYRVRVRVGAAGGIGTPRAAASMFLMGADFVLTGSINQCTVESGASELAKDMLEKAGPQDTDYAPSGDMFELGAQVQVLKRETFFPARANKLFELYRRHGSLDEIDPKTAADLQDKIFKRTFEAIYDDVRSYFGRRNPAEVERAEKNPKHKMALVFRWYCGLTSAWAIQGDAERKLDFQIHCGPALGAFNQLVRGTELEPWRRRHVDHLADFMMGGAADFLNARMADMAGGTR